MQWSAVANLKFRKFYFYLGLPVKMEQSEFSGVVYRYIVIRYLPKMHKRGGEYNDNSLRRRIASILKMEAVDSSKTFVSFYKSNS
jgi:hypothetical protein